MTYNPIESAGPLHDSHFHATHAPLEEGDEIGEMTVTIDRRGLKTDIGEPEIVMTGIEHIISFGVQKGDQRFFAARSGVIAPKDLGKTLFAMFMTLKQSDRESYDEATRVLAVLMAQDSVRELIHKTLVEDVQKKEPGTEEAEG